MAKNTIYQFFMLVLLAICQLANCYQKFDCMNPQYFAVMEPITSPKAISESYSMPLQVQINDKSTDGSKDTGSLALQFVMEFRGQDGDSGQRTAPEAAYGVFGVEDIPIYNSLLISLRPDGMTGQLQASLTIALATGDSLDFTIDDGNLKQISLFSATTFHLKKLPENTGIALIINNQEVFRNEEAGKGALAAAWWSLAQDASEPVKY